MRKLIVVVMLVVAPSVAATPAAAATAGRPAAGSDDAAVVREGLARDGRAHPPSAPSTPQARKAATPLQSDDTESDGETAVVPRHHHHDAEAAASCAEAPAAPVARASAGNALARAPPASP